ncbi:MAG TPA: pilus assembly protein TadG-related protein [Gemmataceae bacterium]|nr:pilus assembly protein TadG-related protein [Gemmataceae bacterium]
MRSARFRSKNKARKGAVAVMVAVCLTMLMAVLALAIDGGNLLDDQRQCQAAADAAALAAACDLYSNYQANQGKDPSGTAKDAALAIAKVNGYNNDGVTNKVYVNIPPKYDQTPWSNMTSQPYKGVDSYVEVIVEYHQKRGFSGLLGSSDLIVRSRAVARGAWVTPRIGILVLNYSGKATLNDQGNGAFSDVGVGPVIVNSSDPEAAYIGGGGVIKAPEYDITGGDAGKLTQFENTSGVYDPSIINTGVHPTPDPLGYLPAPGSTGGYPIPPAANVPAKGTNLSPMAVSYLDPLQVPPKLYNNYYVLSPGSYGGPSQPKLPNFTNGDLVVFKQASAGNNGIYYLASGGFNTNGADIRMDTTTTGGMMLYNAGTGSNDGINIAGTSASNITLGPLTSGIYAGLIYFQARNAAEDVAISGNGNFSIDGTIYAPAANLKVTGNGSVSQIGSQYVSLDLTIAGGGNVSLSTGSGRAKTRVLCLVE